MKMERGSGMADDKRWRFLERLMVRHVINRPGLHKDNEITALRPEVELGAEGDTQGPGGFQGSKWQAGLGQKLAGPGEIVSFSVCLR